MQTNVLSTSLTQVHKSTGEGTDGALWLALGIHTTQEKLTPLIPRRI